MHGQQHSYPQSPFRPYPCTYYTFLQCPFVHISPSEITHGFTTLESPTPANTLTPHIAYARLPYVPLIKVLILTAPQIDT